MTSETPSRVVLYAMASGSPRPAAEFRWSPETGVSMTVIDPKWGGLAQEYYERGVPYDAEQRAVPRTEAETFMRALLQPLNATYYGFVDESESNATPSDEESR